MRVLAFIIAWIVFTSAVNHIAESLDCIGGNKAACIGVAGRYVSAP